MDVNELSRKMYDDIPIGGTLFTVDKIGLRIPACCLNKSNLEPWKKNNYITVLTFGEIAQINIHAEFELWEEHLGKRCLDAILILLFNGVFNFDFVSIFFLMYSYIFPFSIVDKSYSVILLSYFFQVVEWEWAFDFMDYPLFSFIDTNSEGKNNFRIEYNTRYSKDNKKTFRKRKRNGKTVSLSKGNQHSLLSIYNRGKKIGSERIIDRFEVRQQGKYKAELTHKLLAGNKEEAFNKSAAILNKTIKKIIHKDSLVPSEKWKHKLPKEYIMLFSD